MDGHVDFGDLQPRHPLHRHDDVFADGVGELVDGHAELGDDGHVDRGLELADFDGDALRHVDACAGDPLAHRADESGAAPAERMHARHFPGGEARYLGHHDVLDDGAAARLGRRAVVKQLLCDDAGHLLRRNATFAGTGIGAGIGTVIQWAGHAVSLPGRPGPPSSGSIVPPNDRSPPPRSDVRHIRGKDLGDTPGPCFNTRVALTRRHRREPRQAPGNRRSRGRRRW